MMQPDIFIDELAEAKKRHALARSAAASMMLELEIPGGRNISFFLGIAKSLDNQEAITTWILRNTPECDDIDQEIYAQLKTKLYQTLIDRSGHTLH